MNKEYYVMVDGEKVKVEPLEIGKRDESFNAWLDVEGIDRDRLSWKQYQTLNKDFENEKKQNSFSYNQALKKLK